MKGKQNNQCSKNLKLNFIWQVCIEITNMLLPLVTSPILARRLGAEAIGTYSYVNSVSYYFTIIALLGMFTYGTREIALVRDDKDQLNERFSELLFAQIFVGLIVLAFYVIYSLFLSKYPSLFLIQTISLIGSSLFLINWLFAGLEEFQVIALKTMIIRAVGVVLIVFFVNTSADLPIYFIIMACEPLMGALVYIYLARDKVKIVKVDTIKSLKHIKGMLLLFIPVLTTYLYSSMDKVMLGQISTMAQLGYYENATKALIAKNLATALSTVLVPRMSSLFGRNDKEQFNNLLGKSLDLVFLLTIAFGFGTAAVSSIFSVVFWGINFSECSTLILVMSLTIPAYGLTYVINNQYLVPTKRENVYISATILGVIINFILNYVMIPRYAAVGAAIATLVTQYFVLLIEAVVIRNELSIGRCILKNSPYIIFGGIMIMTIKKLDVYLSYTVLNLMLEVVIGAVVFATMTILFWIITKQNQYLDLFRKLFKKIKKN